MTEAEWLGATCPASLLAHLRGQWRYHGDLPVPDEGSPELCSKRKVTLFLLAVCEHVPLRPLIRETLDGIDLLRRFSGGQLSLTHLHRSLMAITERADLAGQFYPFYHQPVYEPYNVLWECRKAAVVAAWHLNRDVIERDDPDAYERCGSNWKTTGLELPEWQASYKAEEIAQAALLREIIDNPFRPVAPTPTWQTSNAVVLARTMYDTRDFTAMPLLADLLEEAGCPKEVSEHCREPGPHARGCWVVDLLLRKG